MLGCRNWNSNVSHVPRTRWNVTSICSSEVDFIIYDMEITE